MTGENEEVIIDELSSEEIAVEKEALGMGWLPEDKFKGPKDRWVPASEFVERGHHVIPIMKANTDRLRADLLTRDTKIGNLEQELKNVRDGLVVMDKLYKDNMQRAITAERTRLKTAYKDAREENDADGELKIIDDLKALDLSEAELKEVKIAPAPSKKDGDFEAGLSPEYKAWEAENPWINTDKKRARLITLIAEDVRKEQPALKGRAFFDECSRILEEEHPSEEAPRRESKVADGNTRGSGPTAKSYASLPADAKKACAEFADKLVGPKKLYKTLPEWQKAYAETYYAE